MGVPIVLQDFPVPRGCGDGRISTCWVFCGCFRFHLEQTESLLCVFFFGGGVVNTKKPSAKP